MISRHGSLPWSVLFEPAVRIARDGFKTTRLLEQRLEVRRSPSVKELPSLNSGWLDTLGVEGLVTLITRMES